MNFSLINHHERFITAQFKSKKSWEEKLAIYQNNPLLLVQTLIYFEPDFQFRYQDRVYTAHRDVIISHSTTLRTVYTADENVDQQEFEIDPSIIERLVKCNCKADDEDNNNPTIKCNYNQDESTSQDSQKDNQSSVTIDQDLIDHVIVNFILMNYLPQEENSSESIDIFKETTGIEYLCIHNIGNILFLANYYDVQKIIEYLVAYLVANLEDLVINQETLIHGFKLAKMYYHVDSELNRRILRIMARQQFLKDNWPQTFERELGSQHCLELMKQIHEYHQKRSSEQQFSEQPLNKKRKTQPW